VRHVKSVQCHRLTHSLKAGHILIQQHASICRILHFAVLKDNDNFSIQGQWHQLVEQRQHERRQTRRDEAQFHKINIKPTFLNLLSSKLVKLLKGEAHPACCQRRQPQASRCSDNCDCNRICTRPRKVCVSPLYGSLNYKSMYVNISNHTFNTSRGFVMEAATTAAQEAANKRSWRQTSPLGLPITDKNMIQVTEFLLQSTGEGHKTSPSGS
jgi:hypothetical protein